MAPKGLPVDIQLRLNVAVKKILTEPHVKKLFADMGLSPVGSSAEYLVEQIRTETAKFSTVAASIPGGIN